jgi:hypothetical protein
MNRTVLPVKYRDRDRGTSAVCLKNLLTHAQGDVSLGTGQETTEGIEPAAF